MRTQNVSSERPLGVLLCLFALGACQGGEGASSDPPDYEPWELPVLAEGEGFSVEVPEFAVESGRESQNCYFVRVPDLNDGEDVLISRFLMAKNPGSHHLNVFRVNTVQGLDPEGGEPIMLGDLPGRVQYGSDLHTYTENGQKPHPCWDSANWADWPLVANSQESDADDPFTDWTLPENVVFRFTPGQMLMVQTHYVNAGEQRTTYGGRVGINFYSHRPAASAPAPMEMGSLFATQQNIRICESHPEAKFSGTCRFPAGQVTIAAANGHFHSRGRQFDIFAWDGRSTDHPGADAQFYSSDAWNHPDMSFDLDLKPPSGGGIWWDCQYEWRPPASGCEVVDAKDKQKQGDCCYTFGGNTDVGEHCNVFLYYYPKLDTDVFCN